MLLEQYIAAVKDEQSACALEKLLYPKDRDSYGYGLACGMVQGMERALEILQQLQDEAAGKQSRPARSTPGVRRNPYVEDLDRAPQLPEQYRQR